MSKFRVHLYPTFLISLGVEAPNTAEAIGQAVAKFYDLLRANGYAANWRFEKLVFADSLDSTVVVDELTDSGEYITSAAATLPED